MATLIVGSFSSKCGACGKGADPNETHHNTVLGYGPKQDGCGALFTELDCSYIGAGIQEATKRLRPDLPFVGLDYDEIRII